MFNELFLRKDLKQMWQNVKILHISLYFAVCLKEFIILKIWDKKVFQAAPVLFFVESLLQKACGWGGGSITGLPLTTDHLNFHTTLGRKCHFHLIL